MKSQRASNQDPQLARVAELEAENARLKAAVEQAGDFRRIADSVDQLIWTARPDGHHDYFNSRWYAYTGAPEGSTQGAEWNGMLHPKDRERAWEVWRCSVETGEPYHVEYRLRHHSGRYRWVLVRAQPVRDASGAITRWYGSCTDIHDLKVAEAALRANIAQARTVADSLPVLISYVDREHCYHFNNKIYESVFGLTVEELRGKHVREVIGEPAFETLAPVVKRVLGGERLSTELLLPLPNGSRHVAIDYVPDRRGDEVIGYFALAQDISERKQNESKLRESEARFRIMANSAPAPAWVTNEQGIEFVNRALADFTGLAPDELKGNVWTTLIHPDDLPGVARTRAEAWQNGVRYSFEARFRRADGAWRWLMVSSRPREDLVGEQRGYVGMAVDVTEMREAAEALTELNQSLEQRIAAAIAEREQIEDALRQSQKMEAVGQLTGGIAHDFNNLLTVITGNVELALRHVGEGGNPRLERILGNALTGAERAAVLTQRLLAFSRRQPLVPKAIDPNRLISGMAELLQRSLGEAIAVSTMLEPGLGSIEIDPNQLENAILNLALNARDAMADGGRLSIQTSVVRKDEDDIAESHEVSPGEYVSICVSDTGLGMDADTLARAYEPFFTTKEVGRGTGLGLSMVYGFVRQSGGQIRIQSTPNEGTVVTLYLPRIAAELPDEAAATASAIPQAEDQETILVCEDDHDVRAYTVEVLRELGYRVIEAADGPSALRLLETTDGDVDLLFTDVVLPGGMNGEALAEHARAMRPDLKVLFTTGYARNAMVHDGRIDPGVELITKPFAYAELAGRVRGMLDAAG